MPPIQPDATQPDPTLLTPKQVGRLVGVGIDIVLTWLHSGELGASNVSNSATRPRWRIAKSDLQSFLDARANQSQQHEKPAKRRATRTTKKYV